MRDLVPSLWSADTEAVQQKQAEIRASVDLPNKTPEEARVAYAKKREWWNQGGPEMERRVVWLDTRYGQVKTVIYEPFGRCLADSPAVIFSHGGGWFVGSSDTHDRMIRHFAAASGVRVISFEYTLAPEAKWPQPLEELLDAITALQSNEIATGDLVLSGDSAGAGLSAQTFLKLKSTDKKRVRGLVLCYGAYGLQDSVSMRKFGGAWDGMRPKDRKYYNSLILTDEQTPAVFDLLSEDLSDLPPVFMVSAEFDPAVDDSYALEYAIRAYGGNVEHITVQGVLHTFLQYVRLLPVAAQTLEDMGLWVRNLLDEQ